MAPYSLQSETHTPYSLAPTCLISTIYCRFFYVLVLSTQGNVCLFPSILQPQKPFYTLLDSLMSSSFKAYLFAKPTQHFLLHALLHLVHTSIMTRNSRYWHCSPPTQDYVGQGAKIASLDPQVSTMLPRMEGVL